MRSKWSSLRLGKNNLLVRVWRSAAFAWTMDALPIVSGMMFMLSTAYLLYGMSWSVLTVAWFYALALCGAYSIGRRRCQQSWLKQLREERDDALRQLETAQTHYRESMQRLDVSADDRKLLLSAPVDRGKDRWQ